MESLTLDDDLPELGLERLGALVKARGPWIRVSYRHKDNDAFLLSAPEHVKHVFSTHRKNYVKGFGMERVRILMGKGLIVSDGELWKRQRKMIQPAFHRRVIDGLTEAIQRRNEALLKTWVASAERKETINLSEDVSNATLAILLEAIFSEDLQGMVGGEGVGPFSVVAEESARDLRFAQRFRALGKPIRAIVEKRRQDGISRPDLLGMLMAARDEASGAPMSDRQLLDEVFTLIIAGHETTAETMAWSWCLLAENPDVQEALHREALTEAPLGALAQRVVKEALRLYPPVWIISRRAVADDEIAGRPIPAGSDVFISPYLMHRDPALWPEPERFLPQRFEATEPPYQYLPFGAGPRLCIGDHLALVESQVHLKCIAARLRLARADSAPIELAPRINLRMKHPLFMRPELR